MANNVALAKGTTISIKVGSTYTPIRGITDFSGLGGGAAAIIDLTDLDSVAKEKAPGVPDEGSFKISGNLITSDAGQTAIETNRSAQTISDIKVVNGTVQYDFKVIIQTFDRGAGVDKQWTFSSDMEITGPITKSTVSGS